MQNTFILKFNIISGKNSIPLDQLDSSISAYQKNSEKKHI